MSKDQVGYISFVAGMLLVMIVDMMLRGL